MKWFCVVFIGGIGLVNIVANLREAWRLSRKKVSECPGVITSAELESSKGMGKMRNLLMHSPKIGYSYVVDGTERHGSRISHVRRSSSDARHFSKLLRRFSPGTGVTVYYDLDDPAECWLSDPRKFVAIHLWVSAGMLIFSVVMIAFFWGVVSS